MFSINAYKIESTSVESLDSQNELSNDTTAMNNSNQDQNSQDIQADYTSETLKVINIIETMKSNFDLSIGIGKSFRYFDIDNFTEYLDKTDSSNTRLTLCQLNNDFSEDSKHRIERNSGYRQLYL